VKYPRWQRDAVMRYFYMSPRRTTLEIAKVFAIHEAEIWNILARYGETWTARNAAAIADTRAAWKRRV